MLGKSEVLIFFGNFENFSMNKNFDYFQNSLNFRL